VEAELKTNRFILRTLSPQNDNFKNYLSWMQNEIANPFIQSVSNETTLNDLHEYVHLRNKSDNSMLFGIFLQDNSEHIGNVKLEPILPSQEATLGILIGEEKWRRKGVGFEVIQAIIEYSFLDLGLRRLKLGVSQNNLAAYKLYKKLGFVPSEADLAPDLGIIMLLERK